MVILTHLGLEELNYFLNILHACLFFRNIKKKFKKICNFHIISCIVVVLILVYIDFSNLLFNKTLDSHSSEEDINRAWIFAPQTLFSYLNQILGWIVQKQKKKENLIHILSEICFFMFVF